MTAHCIDACNLQYSARAKRYTKFLVQQALASHSAISAEQRRRNEEAARQRATIARQSAIEAMLDDDDEEGFIRQSLLRQSPFGLSRDIQL